jgi:hypothetical protein
VDLCFHTMGSREENEVVPGRWSRDFWRPPWPAGEVAFGTTKRWRGGGRVGGGTGQDEVNECRGGVGHKNTNVQVNSGRRGTIYNSFFVEVL